MTRPAEVVALLAPLFEAYRVAMRPASDASLRLFRTRAAERGVPPGVVAQLADFYALLDGVPCLDSLDVHRCADVILFEWWDDARELWLAQRDYHVLRWSWARDRFCVGDAGTISCSADDEYRTFAEALRRLATVYGVPGGA